MDKTVEEQFRTQATEKKKKKLKMNEIPGNVDIVNSFSIFFYHESPAKFVRNLTQL